MQVIGYVRRSTDKQDMSLDQQRAKLQQFAAARGWKLVKIFEDDAISGSEMKRPGLESLLHHARTAGDVQGVIAWERNRLARPKDPLDGLMLERELLTVGKRVFYAATGQEADRSFASGLMGFVEHHQNGDYLRKLSRDTMRGTVHAAKQGLWAGGPIPFGFDRLILGPDKSPKRIVRDMPDHTQVVLDFESGVIVDRIAGGHRFSKQDFEQVTLTPSEPARVQAVAKMFADYASGAPIRVLRDDLLNAGMRTARGRVFTLGTIHAMLENPAYIGRCVYNRRTESKWHRHTNGQSIERQDEGLERRPESDWVTVEDAWPALVDAETFQKVQKRRAESKQQHKKVMGRQIHSHYLLGGMTFCGTCGSRLIGQTTTSGKGYRTRYYICNARHRGDKIACPHLYKVPADLIEQHIIELIKTDLAKLRDDATLHQYVADELNRVSGSQAGVRERHQRRLADLDQQAAKLRDHLRQLDPETAKSLGIYDDAKHLAEERAEVERQLQSLPAALPPLPAASLLRERAQAAFDNLDAVLAGGTIEQKRELISTYVKTIKADQDSKEVQISLYPPLFTGVVAGGGFEPPTSGL